MPNMSYCRFENTYNALSACSSALREEGFDALDSESETAAAKDLFDEAKKFIRYYNDALLGNKHSNAIEDVEADAVSAERARRSYSLPR